MREVVTTLLDVLGLLLVAAGTAAAVYPVAGLGGLAAGGVVVLGGSWLAARRSPPGGEGR